MRDLPDAVKNHRIDEILLLGTHDSGAYKVDIANTPSLEQNGSLNTLVSVSNSLPFLGLDNVISKMTLTQNNSIFEQLEQGVRAFDFRIMHHDGQNKFYLAHSFITVPWETVLTDIQAFMTTHPGEIIVVEMQNDHEHVNRSTPFTNALLTSIQKDLSTWLIPKTHNGLIDNSMTIKNLVASNKRILFNFSDDFVENKDHTIWPNGIIHNHWPNQQSAQDSVNKIESYLPEFKQTATGFLNSVFFTITPDTASIVKNLLANVFWADRPDSLLRYADEMHKPTEDFIEHRSRDLHALQIISVDAPSDVAIEKVIERDMK